VALFEILSEQEEPRGWSYDVQIIDRAAALRRVRMTLSWADYNLWSVDGGVPPSRVAEAVLSFLASHAADDLPQRFDAAQVRRRFPDSDEAICRLARS
jgi:hypothetical protein